MKQTTRTSPMACFCPIEPAGILKGTQNRDRWIEAWTNEVLHEECRGYET